MSQIYLNTLPSATLQIFNSLQQCDWLDQFYLTGGTGLSLQIGHRESEDLDFFSAQKFSPLQLQTKLQNFGQLESVEVAEGTLNLFVNQVKLQFLYYPYLMVAPLVSVEGINVSAVIDIACTKLITISARGSKKDFVDLYFLLQKFSLAEVVQQLSQKYADTNYNLPHILKSLVYFAEAEIQPMPRMHQDVSWEVIKHTVALEVKNFVL